MLTKADTKGACTVDQPSALFLADRSGSCAGVISQPLEIDAIVAELDALM